MRNGAPRASSSEPQQPPAKRQRRSTGARDRASGGGKHAVVPAVGTDEATWAALAEVYQVMGEPHLLHVAYAAHIARYGPLFD